MTRIIPESQHHGALEAQRKRAHRCVVWGWIAALFGILLVMVGILWIFFYAPFLKVRRIDVRGIGNIERDYAYQIVAAALQRHSFRSALGPDNILFWVWSDSSPNVRTSLPALADVSVSVDLFARVVMIEARERKPFGVWCGGNEDECMSFDEEGIAFASAPSSSGTLLLKIDDSFGKAPVLGEPIFAHPLWLSRIKETLNALKRAGIVVVSVKIRDENLREWEVVAPSSTAFYFSFDFVPSQLASVMQDFIKKNALNKLSYIDFRVPGRMYYR